MSLLQNRRTPIGALHRLLLVHIPRALYALDHKISNGRIYASGAETFHFIMYERHPTVLVSWRSLPCYCLVPSTVFALDPEQICFFTTRNVEGLI
jgi:hypothetical protein